MKKHSNLQKVPVEQLIATRHEGQIVQMCRTVTELYHTLEDIKAQMIKDGRLRIVNGKKVWAENR